MSTDIRPQIDIKTLNKVLRVLPADISVLIRGDHGIGKSALAHQLATHFGLPCVDRRLAQMTEGDIIGLPKITDDVTEFLPVYWFKMGAERPIVMLLDELNRATNEVQNAAFQIVLDRELNGIKLHPETRVIACVNDSAAYAVNEMDPALLDRFWVTDLVPTVDDWLSWAEEANLDPVLINFIRDEPTHLFHRGDLEPGGVYPSPRSWHRVDRVLKHANLAPEAYAGGKVPELFHSLIKGLVGNGPAIAFNDYVQRYKKNVNPEDVLDKYSSVKKMIKTMTHDQLLSLVQKFTAHSKDNNWTEKQMANLNKFAEENLTGEDMVILFSSITKSHNMNNIKLMQKTGLTDKILDATNKARAVEATLTKKS